MKNEQGITLITLIVYVILMTFIVAGASSITASFYSNINEFDKASEEAVSYSKFNMYFITDIKRQNAKITQSSNNYVVISYEDIVEVDNGSGIVVQEKKTGNVEYSVQNNILYRNKVKICENVKDVLIIADNTNNTIKIDMTIGSYKKTTTYKLENAQAKNLDKTTM